MGRALVRLYQTSLTGEINIVDFPLILRGLFLDTMTPLLTLAAALFGATLAAQLAVTRLGFSLNKLAPNFNRLNPMSRLKDLPSQNLKAVGEAIVLVVALALFLRSFVASHAEMLLRLPMESPQAGISQVADAVDSLLWKAAALFILFGAFDLFQNYRRQMKTLKMSKQEIKQRTQAERRRSPRQTADSPPAPRIAAPPHDAAGAAGNCCRCQPYSLCGCDPLRQRNYGLTSGSG